ncbi:hypothetical protein ABZV14_09060 [Streptosporangium canum]|uniref:hypothetical protein n=1 Tax=Streptosporangium canum TaxID=324952 RepID=UPI0033BEA5A7
MVIIRLPKVVITRHAEHMNSGKRRNALYGALKAHAALTRLRYTLDSAFPQLGEKWIQPEERSVVSVRRFVRDTAIDWNAAKGIPETAERPPQNSSP